MHSCVYEGWVWHERQDPIRHRFRYALAMLYLDLAELPAAFAGRWLWSGTRPNIAWFRRGDYLGDERQPIDAAVRELLAAEGVRGADGPIRLLTQPRYFGYLINPVSFYFCFDAAGAALRAVIAEVTNTPWKERQCYVLSADSLSAGEKGEGPSTVRIRKQLYVSPFLPLDMEYGWRLAAPDSRLRIDIKNYRHGETVFSAALRLRRREWSPAALRRVLWRHPFMTQRVVAAIYWQALRLWWQGCPVYPHAPRQAAPL